MRKGKSGKIIKVTLDKYGHAFERVQLPYKAIWQKKVPLRWPLHSKRVSIARELIFFHFFIAFNHDKTFYK